MAKKTVEQVSKFDIWKSDVLFAHSNKRIRFVTRTESRDGYAVRTVSAEEKGIDRSYGIWDCATNQGHVFFEASDEAIEHVDSPAVNAFCSGTILFLDIVSKVLGAIMLTFVAIVAAEKVGNWVKR